MDLKAVKSIVYRDMLMYQMLNKYISKRIAHWVRKRQMVCVTMQKKKHPTTTNHQLRENFLKTVKDIILRI